MTAGFLVLYINKLSFFLNIVKSKKCRPESRKTAHKVEAMINIKLHFRSEAKNNKKRSLLIGWQKECSISHLRRQTRAKILFEKYLMRSFASLKAIIQN